MTYTTTVTIWEIEHSGDVEHTSREIVETGGKVLKTEVPWGEHAEECATFTVQYPTIEAFRKAGDDTCLW